MATIVNNPGTTTSSDNSSGTLLGVILLLVITVLFFVYGLPAIRRVSSPQINVPSEIDVNVNPQSPVGQ